jgi:D-xylose transport system substrate-binding protein
VQGAGISPIPPTTGQDAELAAVQRIVAGIQYMTVYKPMRQQAQQAARLAVDLLNGKRPRGATTVATGGGTVQAFELSPEAVTAENLQSTVIASGFHTAAEICTPSYKAYCTKYGIR